MRVPGEFPPAAIGGKGGESQGLEPHSQGEHLPSLNVAHATASALSCYIAWCLGVQEFYLRSLGDAAGALGAVGCV